MNFKGIEFRNIIDNVLEFLFNNCKHKIHLSFDVDVLTPLLAPATGTPVENGMFMSEAFSILDYLKRYHSIKTFDFVEYNPLLNDDNDNTLKNSISIINKVIKDVEY